MENIKSITRNTTCVSLSIQDIKLQKYSTSFSICSS